MSHPEQWIAGFALVTGAGFMQGAFPLPMKFTRAWEWENIWLASSVLGLVVFPWAIAAWTIPDIFEVMRTAPSSAVWTAFLFGAGWGVGGLLFGLGVHRVGLSLTLGIVIGLTSALGSLLPLAAFHPERLLGRTGALVAAAVIVTLVGLRYCAAAGRERERTAPDVSSFRRGSLWSGLAICVASGVLSPMFNFALVCGDPLVRAAAARGAGPTDAPNLILAIAMTGGLIPTAVYCGLLLVRNGTWKRFLAPGQMFETALAVSMGAMFAFSNSAYGAGAARLGALGAVVGWPVFMAMQVVAGNLLGYWTGEWRGAGRRALLLLAAGSAALIAAVFLVSQAEA